MGLAIGIGIGLMFQGSSGGGAPASPPATPTIDAPADASTFFVGQIVAWSATSPDGDLDDVQLVLDPGGGETVLATDATAAYGGNWTVAESIGAHTLVARARRGGQSTDSVSISLTIANPTRQLVTFLASDTWTEPAIYWSPAGVPSQVRARCWGSGGGGTTGVGAGGGGAFSEEPACAPGGNITVTIGAVAVNADGGDTSFGTACIAKGGRSGTNGSTGGTAAGSTGTTKYDGGNGTITAANSVGGGGAGDTGAASGTTPGASTGGYGSVASAGRYIGAGGASTAAAQFAGGRGEVRVDYDVPATAGYPRIRGRSWGRDTANGTSRAATLPSGIVAGEILLLLVWSDGIPDITVSGWTKLGQENEGTSQVSGAWFWKTAAGSDTATIATDASEQVAYVAWRIAGAGTPEFADLSGSSTNPDPPSVTYSGGSIKGLVIAAGGWDSQPSSFGGVPAGFDSVTTIPSINPTGPNVVACGMFSETDTFNPGAFTSATEQWVAVTVVIPPA